MKPLDEQEREMLAAAAIVAICEEICADPAEAIQAIQAALGSMIATNTKDGLPGALKVIEIVHEALIAGTRHNFLRKFGRDGATMQ